MRWPWSTQDKNEVRQSQPFSDAVIQAIVAQADGTTAGDPSSISALETVVALYSRAFAATKVTPATPSITPAFMALVARNLIRRGESLHLIEVRRRGLYLAPVGSWDVRGDDDPDTWVVRGDVFGPSGNRTVFRPWAAFVHCMYSVDPSRPWYGIGPLGWARDTGTLAAALESRLGQEAGGPVGHLLPIPADGGDGGDDDPLMSLKADLRSAKGRPLLVETTQAGFGEGRVNAPSSDWTARRFGANPPAVLPTLRSDAAMSVLSACGVPVSLATDADGTSQRESWRRFIMGSVEPLLSIVRQELEEKLEVDVHFDLSNLWAHDLQGRASAFQKLVAGGVAVNEALATSGLLTED